MAPENPMIKDRIKVYKTDHPSGILWYHRFGLALPIVPYYLIFLAPCESGHINFIVRIRLSAASNVYMTYGKGDGIMDFERLYQSIFRRKSVRKYEMTPLDASVTDEVSRLIPSLKPLFDIRTDISLVQGDTIRGLLALKAPHYLVMSSENREGYLVNAGFILQQMDLALSAMGLGSCWVGLAKPSGNIAIKPGMEFVIAMAFGKAAGSLYRDSLSEFKRKPLGKIANVPEDPLLEAARLAPSSVNSQPWYFKKEADRIHAYCIRTGGLKALIYERLNQIDMGIALCHVWLAGLHLGKDPVFARQPEFPEAPAGYEYVISVSGI